jgi:hypothetical protein
MKQFWANNSVITKIEDGSIGDKRQFNAQASRHSSGWDQIAMSGGFGRRVRFPSSATVRRQLALAVAQVAKLPSLKLPYAKGRPAEEQTLDSGSLSCPPFFDPV